MVCVAGMDGAFPTVVAGKREGGREGGDREERRGLANCLTILITPPSFYPSLPSGLLPCPVIAVPTSVGYGVGKDGLAPLLTMLNACAPGVACVNIDNGIGAAGMVVKILRGGLRKEIEASE